MHQAAYERLASIEERVGPAEEAREAKVRASLTFFEGAGRETTCPPDETMLTEAVRRYLRFTSLTGSACAE